MNIIIFVGRNGETHKLVLSDRVEMNLARHALICNAVSVVEVDGEGHVLQHGLAIKAEWKDGKLVFLEKMDEPPATP